MGHSNPTYDDCDIDDLNSSFFSEDSYRRNAHEGSYNLYSELDAGSASNWLEVKIVLIKAC